MWKQGAVVCCSKITEFAICKYVVLNVETVIKAKIFLLFLSYIVQIRMC